MFSKIYKKQAMMRHVLIALAPVIIYGIYAFGWRVLALLAVNIIVASLVEYISEKYMYKRTKITEAAIVSAAIFTLILPPQLPFYMSAIGMAFAIFFGKQVFGGFGRNPFNPAIVGRVFLYINFPTEMLRFNEPANASSFINGLGGFTRWITPVIDTSTNPTPLAQMHTNTGTPSLMNLFLGNIGGSIGEISTLLIILGAIYLLYKKIASWELMISTLIGFVASTYLFLLLGFDEVFPLFEGMLAGGFMFGALYMVTDPISAPKQVQAKWFYGLIIGSFTVIIRAFSLFPEGMMFAILIAEIFTPIVDYMFKDYNRKKRLAKKKAVAHGK